MLVYNCEFCARDAPLLTFLAIAFFLHIICLRLSPLCILELHGGAIAEYGPFINY
jgi:hypothetical protein